MGQKPDSDKTLPDNFLKKYIFQDFSFQKQGQVSLNNWWDGKLHTSI